MTISKRYELTDEQWERIKPMFPGRPATIDNRTAFNGILWLIRSGATWRDVSGCYGHWKAIYSRFRRWSDTGLFLKMFEELAKNPDMENISLDSTSIRVHQKATGAKKLREQISWAHRIQWILGRVITLLTANAI